MAVITISRGSASGGRMLAQTLAERLGYDIVSREDIVHAAADFGAAEDSLMQALLKPPSFWDRFTRERRRYLIFVQAALCERARRDRMVYHGNAGHLLVPGISHVVRIRLIAAMPFRIQQVQEREHISRDEAIRLIERNDLQRKNWTRFLYGKDWLDPHLYDLTLNLETLTVAGAADVALTAIRREEFAPTPQSRKAMDDLALSSRVRAVLASNDETAHADVTVRAEGGTIFLKGRVRPVSLVDAVIRIASNVEGVEAVNRDAFGATDELLNY